MRYKFSVIVPLYNKRAEIRETIESILSQSYAPYQVVVVDDGSTDGSADIVREFDSPLIKLITQKNAGECAARNRAMAESTGDYYALLDADDTWNVDFLAEMARLIDTYPDCGLYCTAFNIVSNQGIFPSHSPETEGIIDDFFHQSLSHYVCLPSSSAIAAHVVNEIGGFPEGMKLGGDQYMWVKLASQYKVCYSPARMLNYSMVASNRSSAIYVAEQTSYSFRDFYDPKGDHFRNEYIARVEIGKALVLSQKGLTDAARSVETFYSYTKSNRFAWWKLRVLNRIPARCRPWLLGSYNRMAWLIAKKGL